MRRKPRALAAGWKHGKAHFGLPLNSQVILHAYHAINALCLACPIS